jgi:gas vesicle protein
MDFILGVTIGGATIAIVVMFSLARSAKEQDETENELIAEKIEKIKAKRHDKSRDE